MQGDFGALECVRLHEQKETNICKTARLADNVYRHHKKQMKRVCAFDMCSCVVHVKLKLRFVQVDNKYNTVFVHTYCHIWMFRYAAVL